MKCPSPSWLVPLAALLSSCMARPIPHPLPGHPGNVFLAGETVSLPLPAATAWTLADSEGNPVARGAGGQAALGILPVGYYELQVAGKTLTSLAVLAPLAAPTPEDSPVSVDAAMAGSFPPDRRAPLPSLLALAGANWARDRLYWPVMEPARGRLAARNAQDDAVDAQAAAGLKVLQVHHASPPWANPEQGRFPPDLRDAYAFEKEMARRWKGKVFAFEPWNEADLAAFGAHTGAEMASLQKASHLGLKAGNPDVTACLNVLPGPHEATIADLADNKTWPYFDTFNFHHYWDLPHYPRIYAVFRAASAGRPLWVTEANVPGPWWPDHSVKAAPAVADQMHARVVAKVYASAIEQGAAQVFYFYVTMLLNDDLTPRRSYVSLAACGRLMAGAKAMGRLKAAEGANVLVFRARPDGQERDVVVAWADGVAAPIDCSKSLAVYDHLGIAKPQAATIPLSAAPVFAVFPKDTFKTAALQVPPPPPAWKEGKASPVVLQATWPREKVDLGESAYRLVAGQRQSIPIFLYNFGPAAARGSLVVSAPPGWQAQLPAGVELAPGDRKQLALLVTPPAGTAARLGVVTIRGDFGPAGSPVLSLRLLPAQRP